MDEVKKLLIISDEITTIKKISPNVIVIDIQSARHNQLKICKNLKDDFATAFIPIIVLINKRHLRMHLLKNISGSKFMADRRSAKDTQVTPEVYQRDAYSETPKPLGQILIDKKVITPEQLEEALEIHWRCGLILGEVLREIGFIKEEELVEALHIQQSSHSTHPLL